VIKFWGGKEKQAGFARREKSIEKRESGVVRKGTNCLTVSGGVTLLVILGKVRPRPGEMMGGKEDQHCQ